jgi:hypothetical protein
MVTEDMIVTLFNIFISGVAIVLSIYTFIKSRQENSYSDIDHLYFEILKIGIENPTFRNMKYTKDYENQFKDEDNRMKYEIYAHMTFNICETIFDRSKSDSSLLKTWDAVLCDEAMLHGKWLNNVKNKYKFKEEFHHFINSGYCKQE